MKYTHTLLYVADVAKTIDFYTKAFGFPAKFTTPEGDYGEINTGNVTIGFVSYELADSNLKKGFQKSAILEKPFGIELTFTSENIKEDFAKAIKAGAIEVEPLTEKIWGQTIGYLRDINGFLIEIGSPMAE